MKSFDCNSVLEQLPEYLDLDPEDRDELCQAITEHLKHCPDCRVYVDTVRKTIVIAAAIDKDGASMEVPVRVTAKLQQALAREYGRAPR